MSKTEIDITILEDGGVSIGVKGAKGKSCTELTAWLEEELGAVADRKLTPEYYQQEHVEEHLKINR